MKAINALFVPGTEMEEIRHSALEQALERH